MRHKAICRFKTGHEFDPWEVDLSAPSINEIIQVLQESAGKLEQASLSDPEINRIGESIDDLINRLQE